MKLFKLDLKLNAPQIIVLSFFLVIIVGAILLDLPFSSKNGKSIGFVDALFTSTSAVCLTGLVVADTFSQWTIFGKIIITILIQVGGLSFMSMFLIMLVFIGKKITLHERLVIQQSYNQNGIDGMVRLLRLAIYGTLIIEAIGAIILSIKFLIDGSSFWEAISFGVFQSISSFCNAGFDIIGPQSLSNYVGDTVINIVIMLLIIIGGLGFAVWADLLKVKKPYVRGFRLNLHSKIVILGTIILILFGAVFFFCIEYNNSETLGSLSFGDKILASFFQSVTTRTCGYYTVSQVGLTDTSKFMSILLMFIGGSPGSTAGGIKTVTMIIILIAVISILKGKENLQIFKRNIPFSMLQKALVAITINLSIIFISTIILTFSEEYLLSKYTFIDILFETTSAVGTVGLSVGITPYLSDLGKIVLCICMFFGRIGPATVIIALSMKDNAKKGYIQYPEEKVLIS